MPPEITIVVVSPSQIVVEDAEIELTDVVVSFTVTKILRQVVVLQIPSALTKYESVICGVIWRDVPLPRNDPPQEVEYQNQSAAVPVIPPVIPVDVESPMHIKVLVAEIAIAAVELSFTWIEMLKQLVVLQIPSALVK